jgi:hypothetical protein
VFSLAQREGTTMSEQNKTLYERLGGYDGIATAANDRLLRLHNDPQLARFWEHRAVEAATLGVF